MFAGVAHCLDEWKFIATYRIYSDGECVFTTKTKKMDFYCELKNIKIGSIITGTVTSKSRINENTYDLEDPLGQLPHLPVDKDTKEVTLVIPSDI